MCNMSSWNSGCGCGCGGTSFRPTTMTARVLEVQCCSLLVCDCDTCQQVQVNTDDACCYRVGDCLCIHYNGAMTNSLPPQISATCIHRRSPSPRAQKTGARKIRAAVVHGTWVTRLSANEPEWP